MASMTLASFRLDLNSRSCGGKGHSPDVEAPGATSKESQFFSDLQRPLQPPDKLQFSPDSRPCCA
jgi:hypothetical protein